MTTEWKPVQLTTLCTALQPGTLMLPTGAMAPGSLVLLRQGEKVRLLKCGRRSDPGDFACADGSIVNDGASAQYAKAHWWQVLRYSTSAKLQSAIAVLTVMSTLLAAFVTFFNNASSDKNPFAARTAFVALLVAAVLAVVKLVKDWRDAFSGT